MHSYTPKPRPGKAGLALGATAFLALGIIINAGSSTLRAEDDGAAALKPAAIEANDHADRPNRGQTPDYWAGNYWDNRDGNRFWHNLKPGKSTKPAAREAKRPAFGFGARNRGDKSDSSKKSR